MSNEGMTRLFSGFIEANKSGIVFENEDKQVKYINAAFLDMFDNTFTRDDVINAGQDAFLHKIKGFFADEDNFLETVSSLRANNEYDAHNILKLENNNVIELQFYPIDTDSNTSSYAWVYHKKESTCVSALKNETGQSHDVLTGLLNRYDFHDELKYHIALAHRYEKKLSFVLFDIDNHKQVNEKYGHGAGDEVLRAVADLIKRTGRTPDIAGRWGNSEVAVLLPEIDIDNAINTAEKFRKAVSFLSFDGVDIRITASFGVTSLQKTDTVHSLSKRADQALFAAKQTGRNKAIWV